MHATRQNLNFQFTLYFCEINKTNLFYFLLKKGISTEKSQKKLKRDMHPNVLLVYTMILKG